METDPGESTDYIDFPVEKPFINNPSTSELRSRHELPSPQPTAIPVTNSASIISALESLQSKIKELELNREKTLLDLENVSKRVEEEEGTSPFDPSPASIKSSRSSPRYSEAYRPREPSSKASSDGGVRISSRNSEELRPMDPSSVPPLSIPPSSTKLSRTTTFTDCGADEILNLNAGEKIDRSIKDKTIEHRDTGVKDFENGGERLSSNPSTPRNVKEASQRNTALGKQLAFMEKEYGTMSDSLQNLRAMAGMSKSLDKENASAIITSGRIVEKSSRRRSNNYGTSTLMAMQNLEKERASLKISQSLAEARIRALERELENNRLQKSAELSMTPEAARDNDTQPMVNKTSFQTVLSPDINGNTHNLNDFNANEFPRQDFEPEPMSPDTNPNNYAPNGGQICTCDHPEPMVGVRRGRERLCEMQNRLNQQRPSSKSPLRHSPGGRTSPDKGNSRCHYRLNMKHVPFVVGKSTTASHSLTANIQTLVAKLKSHDSGLCDQIRLLHEIDASESPPPPPPLQNSKIVSPGSSNGDKDAANESAAMDPAVIADHLNEVKTVLDALQDEFAAMSFEHHELTSKLKSLGVDNFSTTDDVRSASQDAEISLTETQLADLVAKMNIKGKQIKVLKKILKGLKARTAKPGVTPKSSIRDANSFPQPKPPQKTESKKSTEVQLGKGKRVDVQEGIMVQCIPATARGARDLLYGIKNLHRTLKEADICWQ